MSGHRINSLMSNTILHGFVAVLLMFGWLYPVEISAGWFYENGQKFFVKGIGYETHARPGQVPWVYEFNPDLMAFDLQRIRQAGFNTIRTWGALSPEELQVVEASGLKILFGIWIDPAADYGDADFVNGVVMQVENILAYTNSSTAILGYLIMNEPGVENISGAGALPRLNLWQTVIDLIHNLHPGVAVSFSNSAVGDYIDMGIFDFSAYNLYIYNPVTVSDSHGYAGFTEFLKTQRALQMPLVVTEFGLSVSPGGPNDDYGYGGNTPEQQTQGILQMYRGLIDGGAQGGCVFQYHDGWWKAGNPDVHDPDPEEWFGLIEFQSASDSIGTPRPAWWALSIYNQAIVTLPVNGEVYADAIPLEIFAEDAVSSFAIYWDGSLLLQSPIESYYSGDLTIEGLPEIQDLDLDFIFYNSAGQPLKFETITILHAAESLQFPQLSLSLDSELLTPGEALLLEIQIADNSPFDIADDQLDYVFHPHQGFSPGEARSALLDPGLENWDISDSFFIPSPFFVGTFGTGITARYGGFAKRIYDQQIVIYGDWADAFAISQEPDNLPDLNGDQVVDVLDLMMVVFYSLGQIQLSPEQIIMADLSQDGLVNVIDVVLMVQLILNS